MTNSTKRALRTAFQLAVALVTSAPVLLTVLKGTPIEAQVGIFAAWVAILAKVINSLEDAGLIPAWLKDSPAPAAPVKVAPADVAVTLLTSAENPINAAAVASEVAKEAAADKPAQS